MQTIDVNLKTNPYQIYVESHLFDKIPGLLKAYHHEQKWVILTHPTLYDLYGKRLEKLLLKQFFNVSTIIIPEGESSKSFSEVQQIYSQLLKFNCDRSTTLIALGGGVIGDITGFVASTFMRGIEFIQIPTTLLAMIDSSVGGKTGVNLDKGKNLIGTFYQPKSVFIDSIVLGTLSNRDMVSGIAEVLKYGIIKDRTFISKVNNNVVDLVSLNNLDLLEEVILETCKIKAEIVVADEKESDVRRILNFGHTIGHALESVMGYGNIRHGEAVAYGMICAGQLSKKYAGLSDYDLKLLEGAIHRLQLPKLPELKIDGIIDSIKKDKKTVKGKLNFILIKSIGSPVIEQNVSNLDISESIEYLLKEF